MGIRKVTTVNATPSDESVPAQLAALPGVSEAIDRAREACTALRWHQALRRRIPEAAAESRVRGARASALLEGADVPVDRVRELVLGLGRTDADDPLEQTVQACVQATSESEHVAPILVRAPNQALARLHVAAGATMLPAEQVGRPRGPGEDSRELVEIGPAVPPQELPRRLAELGGLVALSDRSPALVVAAIVHAELAVMRPFVRGNAVVARAFERALLKQAGVDPTGVAVPEVGHHREGATGYAGALQAYAGGTPEGVALWLQHCAAAVEAGAAEGMRIADSVLAGRLR